MKLKVKVRPRSSRNAVVKLDDGGLTVYVTAAPERGKGNGAVIELLAEYLEVKKSRIEIIRGQTSKDKIIELKE